MVEKNLNIELLYFDHCPSWKNALDILEESLRNLGVSQDISLIPVETQEDAEANDFTGSPMIRVNGIDLFPTGQTNYALGCRVYQTQEGYRGWPTEDMVSEKLNSIFRKS